MSIFTEPPRDRTVSPTAYQSGRAARVLGMVRDRPLLALGWALLVGVAFFVLYPLVAVLWRAFGPGSDGFAFAGLSNRLGPVIVDTVVVVLGSTLLAMVIGVVLAWIHERTDANLGWVGEMLPLSTMIVPAIAGVVGWVIMFDPKVGYVNAFLRWAFHLEGDGPVNIYSIQMLIVVSAVYLVPYVFLFMTSALQTLDSAMEEAARVAGASKARTFFRVIAPSLAPSLLASVIIAMTRSLMTFVIVAVVGTRADVETIPVFIYHLMGEFPSKTSAAVLLSFGLMLVIQGLLSVQSRILRHGRFASVGSKGGKVRRARMGVFRPVIQILMGAYLFVTAALPLIVVVLVSIQPAWTANVDLGAITFDAYTRLFSPTSTTDDAIRNSIVLAIIGATIVMVVAVVVLLTQRDASRRSRGFASGLMAAPAVVPHSLVGVAFIVSFSPPPFSLYGTLALLLLAYIVMELPYANQATQAVVNSISKDLPEAARVSGAGEFRTFGRILLPLLLPGIAAGWIIVMIHLVTEATASALLSGISNPVVGPALLGLVADGTYGQVAALAVVIAIITSVLVAGMLWIRRRATAHL